MLTVTFTRDSRGRLSSFFADGHAGWAGAGEDIVCAGASAILQAAWLGITDYARVAPEAERRAGDDAGHLSVRWPEDARDRDDVRAIVGSAEIAIERLALQFPKNVRFRRVQEP